jgi:tRNA threonylcarbamoyladenosine biosynthesis protein TsaE
MCAGVKVTEIELVDHIIMPLVQRLVPGDVVCLVGEMGSGKTTFVRYFCQALGISNTSSPTFTLANIYTGTMPIYHLDLYRLTSESDLYSMDIDRYLNQTDGITFIEWPDRLGTLCPDDAITVTFTYVNTDIRKISFT